MSTETSRSGVGRFLIFGMIGAFAYLAYAVVAFEFQFGTRHGIRSVAMLALPLVAGGYVFAVHRQLLHRIRSLPAAVRFAAAFAAGALSLASIRYFSLFFPVPVAELVVASCIAVLAFGSGPIPSLARPLAPWGLAAGMLGYIALFGVPRIVLG